MVLQGQAQNTDDELHTKWFVMTSPITQMKFRVTQTRTYKWHDIVCSAAWLQNDCTVH